MRSLLVGALMIGVAAPAASELVEFEYQAVIAYVNPVFASIAIVGDLASGRVTYDTLSADTDPDPTVGWYPGATHEVQFGSYSGTSTQSAVRIFDTGDFDAFQIIDFGPDDEFDAIGGLALNSVRLAFNGTSALYTSDALPVAPPPLSDPEPNDIYSTITVVPEGSGSTPLNADLVLLTVPEPAHGALIAIGMLAALASARCR